MSRRRTVGGLAPGTEQLLEDHPVPVRELALALRDVVRSALDEPEERVYVGWGGIGFHHPQAGYVCGIFPRSDRVRLLFEHGAALPDPDALFTGGGRQTRHVDLHVGDAVPEEAIRAMLERAVVSGWRRRIR